MNVSGDYYFEIDRLEYSSFGSVEEENQKKIDKYSAVIKRFMYDLNSSGQDNPDAKYIEKWVKDNLSDLSYLYVRSLSKR